MKKLILEVYAETLPDAINAAFLALQVSEGDLRANEPKRMGNFSGTTTYSVRVIDAPPEMEKPL
jgi:hypothetical protein